MDPMKVWLLLIPVFKYFWHFFIVTKVSQSIKAECEARDLTTMQTPSYTAGIISSIGFCINTISELIRWMDMNIIHETFYSVITGAIVLTGFIAWIVYWVQLAQFRSNMKKLRESDTDI